VAKPKKSKASVRSKSSVGAKGSSPRKVISEAKKKTKKKKGPHTQTFGYLKTRSGGFIAKKGLQAGGEKVRSSKTKIVGKSMKAKAITIDQLDAGAIVTFKYRGPLAHDPAPVVLFLGLHQGRMHGINLRYVPSSLYPRIQQFVTDENIEDEHPKTFYDTKLKAFINANIEPRGVAAYRTYALKSLSNMRIFTISMQEMEY